MSKAEQSKFQLVYDNALTDNIEGKVNIRTANYVLEGIKVSANVYTPAGYDEASTKKYPAIAVAHPNGGVKEQVAGAYAQILAEHGYIAIAADARYQGASEGLPRNTDHPATRIGDISGMVDFLISFKGVDTNRTGALGICGGGGYTLAAVQTDKRIKAVATLSMFNSGRVRRNGFQDSQINTIEERLKQAADARNQELSGGEILYAGDMPQMTPEQVAKLPFDLYREGYNYYAVDYRHPRATGRYTMSSLMELIAFDAEDRMDLINQPLLMMAGSNADTLYMTKDAFEKATGTGTDKMELFLIDGATHIQTYYKPEYVKQATEKLVCFFGKNL